MHRDTQSHTDSRFTSQSCGEKNTQENTKVCSHEKKMHPNAIFSMVFKCLINSANYF